MTAGDAILVTDGTDSFSGSQKVFQSLHNASDFASITAFSSSAADAKKLLTSREARYSGLLKKLRVAEGGVPELGKAFEEATVWVAVNANEEKLLEQVAAAGRSGVKRAFIHLASSGSPSVDTGSLKAALSASGMEYTLMRTGELAKGGSGGGLILSDLDLPACDEVPAEDVFMFVAEALTLEAAAGREFSLCASADATDLEKMRRAGCSRREEVEALLGGKIVEKPPEETAEKKGALSKEKDVKDIPVDDEGFPLDTSEEEKEERRFFVTKARERNQREAEEVKKRLLEEEKKKEEEAKEKESKGETAGDSSGGGGGSAPGRKDPTEGMTDEERWRYNLQLEWINEDGTQGPIPESYQKIIDRGYRGSAPDGDGGGGSDD
jgi:hypothetical protein